MLVVGSLSPSVTVAVVPTSSSSSKSVPTSSESSIGALVLGTELPRIVIVSEVFRAPVVPTLSIGRTVKYQVCPMFVELAGTSSKSLKADCKTPFLYHLI